MEKDTKDELFFVGVQNARDTRRSILESTREIVLQLRSYEQLKLIREQKTTLMLQLSTRLNELERLIDSLKRNVPKTRLREEIAPSRQGAYSPYSVPSSAPARTSLHSADIARLESDLSAIEQKLNTL